MRSWLLVLVIVVGCASPKPVEPYRPQPALDVPKTEAPEPPPASVAQVQPASPTAVSELDAMRRALADDEAELAKIREARRRNALEAQKHWGLTDRQRLAYEGLTEAELLELAKLPRASVKGYLDQKAR